MALASILHPFLIMALVVFLIHRKTFYLHYTCIEALFEDLLGQITEEYYHAIDQLPIDAPFTEVNRVFFEFTARQEPYAERLLCAPGYREFADKLFLNTMIHNRTRHNHRVMSAFNLDFYVFAVAVYSFLWLENRRRWLECGAKHNIITVAHAA